MERKETKSTKEEGKGNINFEPQKNLNITPLGNEQGTHNANQDIHAHNSLMAAPSALLPQTLSRPRDDRPQIPGCNFLLWVNLRCHPAPCRAHGTQLWLNQHASPLSQAN
jgi:hypothetical protein